MIPAITKELILASQDEFTLFEKILLQLGLISWRRSVKFALNHGEEKSLSVVRLMTREHELQIEALQIARMIEVNNLRSRIDELLAGQTRDIPEEQPHIRNIEV